jgi:cyclophilin family peptidyl-prolyl cis-trans isomerase
MSNAGTPDSGGANFFVNLEHNDFLDWFEPATPSKHAVFGQVIEGLDVVLAISRVPTRADCAPVTPVLIERFEIDFN